MNELTNIAIYKIIYYFQSNHYGEEKELILSNSITRDELLDYIEKEGTFKKEFEMDTYPNTKDFNLQILLHKEKYEIEILDPLQPLTIYTSKGFSFRIEAIPRVLHQNQVFLASKIGLLHLL